MDPIIKFIILSEYPLGFDFMKKLDTGYNFL